MLKSINASLLALLVASMATTAFAHPDANAHGHLSMWEGLQHLLLESDHLALLAGAIGVAGIIWRSTRRKRNNRQG